MERERPDRWPLYVPIMLKLPDGRFIFERRTNDAPFEPGKLGMFGGGADFNEEDGTYETAIDCLRREFEEETGLSPDDYEFKHVMDYEILAGDDHPTRYFSLYEAVLPDLDFEAREGQGVEAYYLHELPDRTDLMVTSTYLLRTVLKLY